MARQTARGRVCEVDDCTDGVVAKSRCRRHYAQQRRADAVGPRCSVDACPGPATHVGMCSGHYQQVRAGRALTPIRRQRGRGVPVERDEHGNRVCRYCDSWLPLDLFIPDETLDGLSLRCRRCIAAHHIEKTYGLDRDAFDALVIAQGGVCAICPTTLADYIAVDHDHSCCPGSATCGRCVRGLLCRACNTGLGLFRDDEDLLRRAIKYLEVRRGEAL